MLKIQHSVISPESVLKLIQKHYPAIGATDCELLALGCNDNYRLKGKRKDYAFRLCRLDWWPEHEFDEELRFLEAMRRKKINVSKPVRDKHKNRYIKIKAAEGLRYGALFEFIPGKHLSFNYGLRNKNLVELGRVTAQLHSTADSIKKPVDRWHIGFDNVVTEFIEKSPVVLGHREKDMNYLKKLASQLEAAICNQEEGALDYGLCHGDLHLSNVMLQPDGELAIFDFDWCGYSWRAYDLATVWWSLTREKEPQKLWNAFLRGYTQLKKLSKQEKALLPWFVVFRHFEFLNFQLSMRGDIGSSWLNDNYYDFHLGFFRRWVKEHKLAN